ncbi:MAG: GlmU family protein [Bacteroidetes bacterium]|nr:GlmU family protein [Bacteroidota bacterium]
MNIILFDDEFRVNLLPLTYTRPCGNLRVGIFTIAQKWENYLSCNVSYKTKEYLSRKYKAEIDNHNIFINGRYLPSDGFCEVISNLRVNEIIFDKKTVVAFKIDKENATNFIKDNFSLAELNVLKTDFECSHINFCYDIFRLNGDEIEKDFKLIVKKHKTAEISRTNQLISEQNVFIEEGAKVEFSILNAAKGPIYIGKNAEVLEGSLIRGPFALCENSELKMGAKIYGPTTIGPHSKVGGEVNNCVFQGFSNKAHDGFLGNSVIGEWCNIGADSNTSNLKNNYAEVKLWNYTAQKYLKTGLQFCGTIMGDHSKCGINTMFNTGTVAGVSANIFGTGFPRNFIPDFSWGGSSGFETYNLEKVFEVAKIVMERRGVEFNRDEQDILTYIFYETSKFRVWENAVKKI